MFDTSAVCLIFPARITGDLMTLRKLIPFDRLKACYEASPLWLKSCYASIPFSVRAGRLFRETTRLIEETEFLTHTELATRQSELLSRLIEHAFTHVPFYRQAMDRAGLLPKDIREASDLAKLPLLPKKILQDCPENFIAQGGIRERVFWANTGGSSGTPFRFLSDNSTYPIEMAYILSQWKRIGYSPGERRLTLRGQVIDRKNGKKRWQYNPIYNELRVSSYHLDIETLAQLMPEIKRFRPTYLYGYPAAITLFLRTMIDNGLTFPHAIKGVLCGSEPLFDYQRELIQNTLGCRAYSWYGQSERVLLAGECEHSTAYHSFPLYGILELVDEQGSVISEPGIEGEIIGTSLNSMAMPLIRYRTGDRAIYDSFGECPCKRNFPRLIKVTGRCQDYVYTRAKQPVPVTAFVFGQHFNAFARIHGMQLFQDTPGVVTVRIVRGPQFSETDEREIRQKMESCVDGGIRIGFEYVGELPTTPLGKAPFVVQKVD